jgi:2-amino-4-hydroxy-6-hydroxymethyldihydropteridine diphosphokinase
MGVPDAERQRWLRAVWLHDALKDAPPAAFERWAAGVSGPNELRHGPASAARAAAEGETDRGVLDAVRYHSVGYADWDMVGRALYAADYLEPGRRHGRKRRADLAKRFPEDPTGVLTAVAAERLTRLIESRWPIPDLTVRFWNSLVERSGSR